MNLPLCLLTFAHWICAAAAAQRASLLLQEGISSGRRTCRLYCRVGIGFHLQIHPDGRVNGSHEPNQLSVLELIAISQGVIGIKGVYSNRFLAMNKRGRLHATEWFSDDCKFRERFQENSYNTYASVIHRNQRTGREWASLHDFTQKGFTITERSKEKRKAPPPSPPRTLAVIPKAPTGPVQRHRQVKYWPKFRFG
ncbi:fibroblast growth factor 5 isoform X2 [Gambusia affinis]|uniref:fibroblast growth factor 5 isoform X2 n=1 Tax=Gambusia affinis TaxID=33528 RepID=UPI001CDB8CFE|nr:fibroblast growth factor 5 isoform X2 [Gambusia affinis]